MLTVAENLSEPVPEMKSDRILGWSDLWKSSQRSRSGKPVLINTSGIIGGVCHLHQPPTVFVYLDSTISERWLQVEDSSAPSAGVLRPLPVGRQNYSGVGRTISLCSASASKNPMNLSSLPPSCFHVELCRWN